MSSPYNYGNTILRAVEAYDAESPGRAGSSDQTNLDGWYAWATTSGYTNPLLMVDMQADSGVTNPPVSSDYATGLANIVNSSKEIEFIVPWNEPNHTRTQNNMTYVSPDPWTSAQYLADAAYICGITKKCSVVAGDFAGVPYTPDPDPLRLPPCNEAAIDSYGSYVDSYFQAIGCQYPNFQPTWWAFHAWGDVERYEQSMDTDTSAPITHYYDSELNLEAYYQLNVQTPLKLWNNETGAWYKRQCSEENVPHSNPPESFCDYDHRDFSLLPDGTPDYWWGMDHQASAAAFLLQTTSIDSNIDGLLYYDYQRGPKADDPGLVGSPWDDSYPRGSNGHNGLALPSAPNQRRNAYCILQERISTSNRARFGIEHSPTPPC